MEDDAVHIAAAEDLHGLEGIGHGTKRCERLNAKTKE